MSYFLWEKAIQWLSLFKGYRYFISAINQSSPLISWNCLQFSQTISHLIWSLNEIWIMEAPSQNLTANLALENHENMAKNVLTFMPFNNMIWILDWFLRVLGKTVLTSKAVDSTDFLLGQTQRNAISVFPTLYTVNNPPNTDWWRISSMCLDDKLELKQRKR